MFFGQNLIDITIKIGQCNQKPKVYHLVLKIDISYSKNGFLFIFLFYTYPMVYANGV